MQTKFTKVFVILMFFCSVAYFAAAYVTFTHDGLDKQVTELKESVVTDIATEIATESVYVPDDENLLRQVDFAALQAVNSDITNWLYLPDTNIDYPVLQEQELHTYYYLNHDYEKNYSVNGSVFMPKEPMDANDAHALLFAHNMMDKSVAFSKLPRLYSDESYGREHPYLYRYYPDKAERWKLWCVVKSNANDSVYEIPYTIGSSSYDELLQSIDSRKLYAISDRPTRNTYTTVLSTCNSRYRGGSERFYMVYVLDEKYEY